MKTIMNILDWLEDLNFFFKSLLFIFIAVLFWSLTILPQIKKIEKERAEIERADYIRERNIEEARKSIQNNPM
jgi:HAMP domain-containing protein